MNYVGKKRNRPGANKKIIKVKKNKGNNNLGNNAKK